MKNDRNYAPANGGFVVRPANRSWHQRRGRRSRRLTKGMLVSIISLTLVFTPLAGWRTSAQSLLCDISQITFTTGGGNSSLAFTDDGAQLAFLSNRDLAGGNADGNFEIFLYNTQAGSFTQVTDSTEELAFVNFDLSIGGDGTRLAFKSTLDLTGGNADGNSEIFFFDTGTSSFTQVTHTTGFGESDDPALSDDGTRLAFQSSHDLTGGNPDGNQEILLYNTQTGSFTQLTNTTGTTQFTYQGRLTDGGNPANTAYDMQFRLFDSADFVTGNQVGTNLTKHRGDKGARDLTVASVKAFW